MIRQEALLKRYDNINKTNFLHKIHFHSKRLFWIIIVRGSYLLKRLLTPLFLIVALLIRFESPGSVLYKQTRVGRFIRKGSIDELPQLWNVLKGDLVGPRPPIPKEVDEYSLADRRRLEVIPGITCIWQVSGRSDIPFPEQVKLDVQYIESQSFLMDIKILFQTIPAVLLGKGAY
ncbi:hypothetical protein PN36_00935 [Candidatus Thiomargarita nelsonii]|uniref:Bacterial sugar transferase domain-containing protein n=1 Tax=Candidatus Thiomargarita nelsonii TaxID=1003181 RepID=A0A0A6P5I1_9GAMM|nr:hypothetical protein PN36_00935 [Candidatus Thiomargarita nelsonii]